MPTYEYKCRDCGDKFDEFQKITDPPLTKCPACGGDIDRLISGGLGILFKGSGFYLTDYRSEGYKKAEQKDKSVDLSSKVSPSTEKPSKAEKTTNSKPAKND
jgi:putative FmdB family regulatory protein